MSTIVEQLTQGRIETKFGKITDEDLRSITVYLATLIRHPGLSVTDSKAARNIMFNDVMCQLRSDAPEVHDRLTAMIMENSVFNETRFWDRPADLVNSFAPL